MPNQPKHINKKHLAHLEVVRRQERIIRIVALIVIVVVVGIVGYGILTNTVLMPYRLVASVNGDNINAGEFQAQVKIQRIQAIQQYNNYMQYAQMFGIQDPMTDSNFGPVLRQVTTRLNSTDVMGQLVIDLLINDRLIRQEAKKRGITVSAADVDKALQESVQYYPNGTPTVAPTATGIITPTLNPTELSIVTITPTPSEVPTETPAATATSDAKVTPTQTATVEPTATTGPTATNAPTATAVSADGYKTLFKDRIDNLKKSTGLDEAGYRRLVETGLLRDKLLADITKGDKPFQEQVWFRDIVVATQADADAVVKRLKAGEDFGKVAAAVSLDTNTKDKGGDLGWQSKDSIATNMTAPLADAIFALQVGQISDPIKGDSGFHIIQVIGHENRPLTDQEFTQDKQTKLTTFLKSLRDVSDVKIYDLWKSIVPTEPALPTTAQQ